MLEEGYQNSNLLIVVAVEEYGLRHNMKTDEVIEKFELQDIFSAIRSQYEVLHMVSLGEVTLFVEDLLKNGSDSIQDEEPILSRKFIYKGMDLTLDIYEQIRRVVEMIAKKENMSFENAYALFSKSNAYRCLTLPETVMWGEWDGFIVNEFYRERDKQ